MRKNNRNKEKRVIITDIKKMLKDDAPLRIKEAYSLVRAKLLFTAKGEKCPVYVITSSGSDEGKTINSINMAISFAMAGKKTLLIDADLRNPTVHKYFRLSPSPGLSEVLAKIQGKINIVKTEQENLFFLRAGEIPPNPAELLGSAAFANDLEIIQFLYEKCGADINGVTIYSDGSGVTALETAIGYGYFDVIKYLVKHGADTQNTALMGNLYNEDDPWMSALDYASMKESEHIIEYFQTQDRK